MPKFVLSPYRSGTTLLRYCLDSHPAIAVPPETDYLAHLGALLLEEASSKGLQDLGYDAEARREAVGGFGRAFLDTYASSKSKPEWIDKSPRYAECPLAIDALYPNARYAIMHRHPLDQVFSFTKGGRYIPSALANQELEEGTNLVLAAANYWSRVSSSLASFAVAVDSRATTIFYEDLCDFPRETLRSALEGFRVEWDESVLNYHLHDHDLGREAGRVQGTVGFSKSSKAWESWPTGLVDEVWGSVSETAERLGYRRDGGRQ
ncbi:MULTISPECIES: sulfotransferase family protein [unclassified Dietzia]|uniref:sulfotransferase family protein n=1 Tax=unclassified Dietzia TaxID=2617939 RepID=UPI0015FA8158|nr:sulfotransferase [Dietzia sp. DQ12-76]MBB1022944.1 sulfotransferase [Dietzia sp. DQ12-76]MBB1029202.1 sulfotransferase [Dietzia sp. DQ11-38-2]